MTRNEGTGSHRRPILVVAIAIAAALLLGAHGSAAEPVPFQVHFIDVGQGDSCWLHLPSGEDILIDGGGSSAGPTVVAYLTERDVQDLDLLVGTHSHQDHIGGLVAVVEALPVGEAWLDAQDCETDTCLALLGALAERQVTPQAVRAGATRVWDQVFVLVLNPQEPLQSDENQNSIVLLLSYGELDLLLTGDAGASAERRMLTSQAPLEAEILKVGHHGSASSTSPEFLLAISPEEAIISVGRKNAYGHPDPTLIARLQEADIRIWRTDQQGNILLTADQTRYSITAFPHPTAEPTAVPPVYIPFLLRP